MACRGILGPTAPDRYRRSTSSDGVSRRSPQTGAVFHPGPDLVRRGTIKALYHALLNDDGDLAEELFAIPADARVPLRTALARSMLLSALWSRFTVGWAMSERITDDLTRGALDMALARRR